MRIIIGYPPLPTEGKIPLLGQNRQFQWSYSRTFIYPLVPASAATLLKSKGYRAFWLDGIAECWTYAEWEKEVKKIKPDIIFLESKTPVIKRHWQIINDLKKKFPKTIIVLAGDHVTALPEESMKNSKVDFIITGGDYDFLLLNITNHLSRKEKLEPGIWYRSGNKVRSTGQFQLNHDLETLPFIDRELTKWKLYAYKNGNYRQVPATYTMAGRDCWWRANGGCAFCAWTTLYPKFRTRSPKSLLDEIGILIEKYGVKEVFDDTGTIPYGKWLKDFCRGMIKRGYHKKISLGCNLRFGILKKKEYRLMAKAGFRLLLFGLESASQKTLDRLGKGITVSRIKEELFAIKKVNEKLGGCLEPHLTFMVGYPWEKDDDLDQTVSLAKIFFTQGLISSLQATIVIPYPGTRLYQECKQKSWLKTNDWRKYDMKSLVMKTEVPPQKIFATTRNLYVSFLSPGFVIRKLINIRSRDDFKFLFRAAGKIIARLRDF